MLYSSNPQLSQLCFHDTGLGIRWTFIVLPLNDYSFTKLSLVKSTYTKCWRSKFFGMSDIFFLNASLYFIDCALHRALWSCLLLVYIG